MRIEIVIGNIVRQPDVDALVNSANENLGLVQVSLVPSTQQRGRNWSSTAVVTRQLHSAKLLSPLAFNFQIRMSFMPGQPVTSMTITRRSILTLQSPRHFGLQRMQASSRGRYPLSVRASSNFGPN